jgi:CRISPR-associated protein Csm3
VIELAIEFQKNIIISGELIVETGLHIGGEVESVQIGDAEKVIIRDPNSDLPYVPGSSLKGTMRSLLELFVLETRSNLMEGDVGQSCTCGECPVCVVFGAPFRDPHQGPTRLIVRDAHPTPDTVARWLASPEIIEGAEVKWENNIDRFSAKSTARMIERVPKGSKFAFEMIYGVYCVGDYLNFPRVLEGMKLLEDGYLGGHGTRGYGRIRFDRITLTKRTAAFYQGTAQSVPIATGRSVATILRDPDLIGKLIDPF